MNMITAVGWVGVIGGLGGLLGEIVDQIAANNFIGNHSVSAGGAASIVIAVIGLVFLSIGLTIGERVSETKRE